ncbi:spore coat associated protein CotJA [Clostridium beijerinckii]|uniref:spore coat associated protein CotJA n=1 Tax=Clostridium beijerinckii TaxID=1520 RepID=UPI0003D34FB4|nr:spore coat associated protein CotJA [Clostridium beijerinckii]ALB46725.1 spore coat associated protein CotJA [Clostridium beijerinckii NRRL B-598]MBA8935319.1 ABC-type nickel/cobalt efflux system permease component RcnA [Clostridium beijerinckii]NRT34576.1 ABC-type nickel/cobalt efflux system permease component RcnA [Clostridium beijerinckii]NRT45994.1 ABC-type nickel/cobalt efflux system permease component RcnA [Clostridium beijerinckii]NRU39715.1 ABC-type nickel/cobalt efflux system perme
MYRRDDDDCMCKSKEYSKEYSKKYEYARAYILPQKYENLYSCKEGFVKGTIFKDLYRPYKKQHDHKGYDCDHDHHEHEHEHEYDHEYEFEYKKIKYER